MKILKHISRYFFMALLLAGCVLWSLYCGNAAAQLQAQIKSPAFIDMTVNSIADAIALMDRQAYFVALMRYGIIAAVVVVLLTCAMIVTPILVKKWRKRPKRKPAAPRPDRRLSASVGREAPKVMAPVPPVFPEASPAEPSEPYAASGEPPVVYEKPEETLKAPLPAPEARPSRAVFCPRCGKRQKENAKFCFHCGQPL